VFQSLDATGRGLFCGNKPDRRQAVARARRYRAMSPSRSDEYLAQEFVRLEERATTVAFCALNCK
jgi:hypothetical protein